MNFQSLLKILLIAWLTLFGEEAQSQPSFTNVAGELGLTESYSNLPIFGGGLSIRDFNGDGWDDITMCTIGGEPVKFFQNNYGAGFEEVFPIQTLPEKQFFFCWIDFDNDTDLDAFIVTELSGVHLYRNDGGMLFNEITFSSGLSGLNGILRTGCAFGDFNNDGLIDLYVPNTGHQEENKMFFQDSNNIFNNVSAMSGTGDSLKYTFQGVLIDYNHDGWVDLYLANDVYDGNTLFRNNGDSTFTDVSVETGAYQELDAMGLAIGDFDNDLDLDIHITDKIDSKLLELTASGTFNEVGSQRGVDFANGFGWGNNFFDADLDGDEDLYVSSSYFPVGLSQPSILYINDGTGSFNGQNLSADSSYSFTNVIGDFNNDRKTDIAVLNSNDDPINLWKNESNTNALRFSLKLEGCTSNREAAGAKVIAFDGAQSRLYSYHVSQSFLGQNSDKKIIPILNGTTLDSLTITWPNGNSTSVSSIEPNQTLVISECSSPKPLPVITVPNYSTQGLTSCSGDSVLLVVNGNYPNVIWSNGETDDSIYVSSAGSYNVNVVNQFGVAATSSPVSIIEREYPMYTINSTIASCFNDGAIQIVANDSNALYSYNWNNESTSDSLSNLSPETYHFTVTDQGECAVEDSVVIDGPANFTPIRFNGTSENAQCHNESSGIISVFPSGGSSPYEFLWSNQDTTSSIDVTAGNYSLTISDSYNCQRDTSFKVYEPDQILAYIDVNPDTNMTGIGMITLDVFGGTPPYSIEWYDAQNQTGSNAQNLTAGEYIAQITDANSCTRNLEIAVPNIDLTGAVEIQNEGCELICSNQSSSIMLQLTDRCAPPFSLEKMSVFNIQGQPINFESSQISNTKTEIVLDEIGVFLILDHTGRSCKVLRLNKL